MSNFCEYFNPPSHMCHTLSHLRVPTYKYYVTLKPTNPSQEYATYNSRRAYVLRKSAKFYVSMYVVYRLSPL